jgi:DNA-binding MarR family transcriptional regulator
MSEIDNNIVDLFEKISRITRFLMWETAKNEKMSPVQMQFLLFIQNNPPEYNKVNILAKEFDLTLATVSDAISSLKRKKYLTKVREENDRRSYILKLTGEGENVVKRVSDWSKLLKNEVGKFKRKDKVQTKLFLMDLVKSLYNEGVIGVARMCSTCSHFERIVDSEAKKSYKCKLTGKIISEEDMNYECSRHLPL